MWMPDKRGMTIEPQALVRNQPEALSTILRASILLIQSRTYRLVLSVVHNIEHCHWRNAFSRNHGLNRGAQICCSRKLRLLRHSGEPARSSIESAGAKPIQLKYTRVVDFTLPIEATAGIPGVKSYAEDPSRGSVIAAIQ